MSDSIEKDDERLAALLEYFGDRLNLVFAYFFCALEFEGDADMRDAAAHNDRALSLQVIENACIHSTLIALRDLDDFLHERTSSTQPDDVRISDFGFNGKRSFLTTSDRVRINKSIAHTTTTGAATHPDHWDILELATKGVSQCVNFLTWVEKEYGLDYFNLYSAALVIRKKALAQLDYVQKAAEARRPSTRE